MKSLCVLIQVTGTPLVRQGFILPVRQRGCQQQRSQVARAQVMSIQPMRSQWRRRGQHPQISTRNPCRAFGFVSPSVLIRSSSGTPWELNPTAATKCCRTLCSHTNWSDIVATYLTGLKTICQWDCEHPLVSIIALRHVIREDTFVTYILSGAWCHRAQCIVIRCAFTISARPFRSFALA